MAQDKVLRMSAAGAYTSELTADNIEDFDNASGALAYGDVVYATDGNAVAKADSATWEHLPIGIVIKVKTATSCRVITRGAIDGMELTAGATYYLNGTGTLSVAPATRVVPVGIALNVGTLFVCPLSFNIRQVTAVNQYERCLRSVLTTRAGSAPGSQTAWWTYLGYTVESLLIKYVEFYVSVVGVGTQVAEVGLFSTPLAPNKTAQTITKLTSTDTLDSLTVGIGVKRNTNSLNYRVDPGVHLWAGVRFSMQTTQPNIVGLSGDCNQGRVLLKTSSASFASGSTWASALFTDAGAVTGYHIMATLD